MGLDQYAYIAKYTESTSPSLPPTVIHYGSDTLDLHDYWYGRKINTIQGYFEDKAHKDYGAIDINCAFVPITEDDLNTLEQKTNHTLQKINKLFQLENIKFEYTPELDISDELASEIKNKLSDHFYETEWESDEDMTQFVLPRKGFFYGTGSYDVWWIHNLHQTLNFVELSREQLRELQPEEALMYSCWY